MKKRLIPHFIAIAGFMIFGFLALGSATLPSGQGGFAPTSLAAPPAPAAEAAAEPAPAPRAVVIEDIGRNASVARAPWSAHSIIPSKNYSVVGAIVVRTTNSATILADLMERAIALGGHDIKNVIVTRTITDDGAEITSAIAVAIRYTNETLEVQTEEIPGFLPMHRIQERYVIPRDVMR